MSEQVIGSHNGLHSEQGARPGEHRSRSANPIIKVQDVIWLEFEKPDLNKAEAFAHAFGFATALRTDDELHLRGSDADAPCVLIRRGEREKCGRDRELCQTAENRRRRRLVQRVRIDLRRPIFDRVQAVGRRRGDRPVRFDVLPRLKQQGARCAGSIVIGKPGIMLNIPALCGRVGIATRADPAKRVGRQCGIENIKRE